MTRKEAEEKLDSISVYAIERIVEEMNPKLLHDYIQERKRKYYYHRYKNRIIDAIILTAESTDADFDDIYWQCPVCLSVNGHSCSARLPWAHENICIDCRENARKEKAKLRDKENRWRCAARDEAHRRLRDLTLEEMASLLRKDEADYYDANCTELEDAMMAKLKKEGWTGWASI